MAQQTSKKKEVCSNSQGYDTANYDRLIDSFSGILHLQARQFLESFEQASPSSFCRDGNKKKKLRDAKLGQQLQLINEPFTNFTSTNYLPYKFIAFHPLDSSQRPPRPGPQEWPREPGPIILYEDKNYPAYRPGQACGWDNNSYT